MQDSVKVAGLRRLLKHHLPVDAREQEFAIRCSDLLGSREDPFRRSHFEPGHFTASAFVLSPDGADLLLIHHRKLGRWLQPGGHFEASDRDVFVAARREVLEETGLRGLQLPSESLFDVDVHAIPALGDEPLHEHFDLRLLFRSPTETLNAGPEVKDARWFALSDITDTLSDESVMRAIRKISTAGASLAR